MILRSPAILSLPFVLAPLATGACSTDEPRPPDTTSSCTPDAASIEQDVFATSCLDAGCHNAADLAGGLDLESPGAAEAMIRRTASTCQRTLILPGDPDGSFLFEKLTAEQPECGTPMPVGAPLDDVQLACVRDWIAGLEEACDTCGGESCIDTQTDPIHCGACDSPCPAEATCEAGTCVCDGGEAYCGGACVDNMSNPDFCGDCDTACVGMQVCSLGSCKNGCDGNLTACDGACVDTTNNPDFCGDCNTSCGANEVCDNSACVCPGGVDLMTDPNNCGSCGNQCSPGEGCVAGECTCASTSVSFASDIQPIFNASCDSVACHGGVMAAAGLNLTSGSSYGELVGVSSGQCASRPIVDPGAPENSYLLDKLLGVDLCFGTKMPKMGSIASGDIVAISSWICDGAQNN